MLDPSAPPQQNFEKSKLANPRVRSADSAVSVGPAELPRVLIDGCLVQSGAAATASQKEEQSATGRRSRHA